LERAARIVFLTLGLITAIPQSYGQGELTSEDCLVCHSDEELTRELLDGEIQHLFVDRERYEGAVHGALSCTDCHSDAVEIPHEEWLSRICCRDCHEDVGEEFERSTHGVACGASTEDAPSCLSCHGDIHAFSFHDDPSSPVHPTRLAETCGECHANPDLVEKFGILIARPLEAYKDSVHARAVMEGQEAATCNDCHDSHRILPGRDLSSTVARHRVPFTCGTCHEEIAEAYRDSIHGTAFYSGVFEAPVCTDCHGEHRILSPGEPGSPVYIANEAKQTCGHCHEDVRLSDKYNLPMDRVSAYYDSYHGLAVRSGRTTVASCSSCHGIHDILPSSDPDSHVHWSNLPETCGQCHPGAGERFAIGAVHVVATEAEHPAAYYVRLIYLPLIFLTIGGMALHNLADLLRKSTAPRTQAESAAAEATGEERMMLGFRIAHLLVVVSFPLLVYTGFALKYPESWWAQPINYFEADIDLRGWSCILQMRPRVVDIRELKDRFLYYLGKRKHPPHGIRVGYIEKSEYVAFIWGTFIMGVTGFLLWFENVTLQWLPSWIPEAATAIHFYEAILASLAVLVWHFYWVIFDPDVYPMDASWWTGRAPASRELERRPAAEAESASSTSS
jgi:cytochrome b subunit of formate dehydrogenase